MCFQRISTKNRKLLARSGVGKDGFTRQNNKAYLTKYVNQEEALYQIQMLMAYGKLDMVDKFQRFSKKMDDTFKMGISDYMRKRVIQRFWVTSRKISNEQLQNMISIHFPMSRPNNIYRNILISREKNEKKQ